MSSSGHGKDDTNQPGAGASGTGDRAAPRRAVSRTTDLNIAGAARRSEHARLLPRSLVLQAGQALRLAAGPSGGEAVFSYRLRFGRR